MAIHHIYTQAGTTRSFKTEGDGVVVATRVGGVTTAIERMSFQEANMERARLLVNGWQKLGESGPKELPNLVV